LQSFSPQLGSDVLKFQAVESFFLTLEDACLIGGKIYTLEEISNMELQILKTLKWRLHLPTASEISHHLLSIFEISSEIDIELLLKDTENYIEFCLLG